MPGIVYSEGMKRFQRLAVELFAIFGIWLLWDFRMAATLFLILCVVEAIDDDRQDRARRAAAPK